MDLIHFFDPIQYELWLNTLLEFDLEPESKLQSTSSLRLQLWLHNTGFLEAGLFKVSTSSVFGLNEKDRLP